MTVITKQQHKQDLKNQRDENRIRCTNCQEYNHTDRMPRDDEGLRFCSEDCKKEYHEEVEV